MKKFISYIILVFISSLCYACSVVNADEDIKYANNIFFNTGTIYKSVGDKIEINNDVLTILPKTTTQIPILESMNQEIFSVSESVVSCLSVGTGKIKASILIDESTYKVAMLTIVVIEKQVYPTTVSFAFSDILLNCNETSVNKLNIMPVNTTVQPAIRYSTPEIVHYNASTGEIIPTGVGKTTVFAKIKIDELNYTEVSFSVNVTNYIYATDITIDNITENNGTYVIDVFTNSSGKLNFVTNPSNYNMGIEIINNYKDYFTIDSLGNYEVKNSEIENATITIKAKSSQNAYVEKEIILNIIKPVTSLTYEIYENNHMLSHAYVSDNVSYKLKITSDGKMKENNLYIMPSVDYTVTKSENLFEYNIIFHTAGAVDIVGYYSNVSYVNTNKIYFTNYKFMVYSCVEDINLKITNEDVEIPNENDVYSLFLFDESKREEAKIDECFNNATIKFSSKNLNSLNTDLSIKQISGNSVIYKNGSITAVSAGITVFKIFSNDPKNFSKLITISVKDCVVTDIKTNTEFITLYITKNNSVLPNTFLISSNVVPSYALNNSLTFEVINNEIISYKNNLITALSVGNTSLILKNGNITKVISIHVKSVVSKIIVETNINNSGNNISYVNNTLEVKVTAFTSINGNDIVADNSNIGFRFVSYSNGVEALTTTSECVLETSEVFVHKLNIHFIKSGFVTIRFHSEQMPNVTKDITIEIKNENHILDVNFSESEFTANMKLGNTAVNNYNLVLEDNYEKPTDVLTFKSDNENIAEVSNDGTLTLKSTGTCYISAYVNDEFVKKFLLKVINKNYVNIFNANDFAAIKGTDNYILQNDIELPNTYASIPMLSGEFNGNSYSISGVCKTLFLHMNTNAYVYNLNIINSYMLTSENNSALFTNLNEGIIENISLQNCVVDYIGYQTEDGAMAGFVFNNKGTIDTCNISVSVIDSRQYLNAKNSTGAGLVYHNSGLINNIKGEINLSNFSKSTGIVYNNSYQVFNINAVVSLEITGASKLIEKQFAGGVFYTKTINKQSEIKNCNLIVIYNGDNKISYGGFVMFEYDSKFMRNCFVENIFKNELTSAKVGLFAYINSNNNNVFENCSYSSLANENGVYEGNDYFIRK